MADPVSSERAGSHHHDVTGWMAKPMKPLKRVRVFDWKLGAVAAWLAVTLALATWWMIFGLQQLDRMSKIAADSEMARQHRMLMSEGATLILLLLAGGGALLYYINTEIRRARKIQEFFAAFTHDLKTSLASLRLQAESLEENLAHENLAHDEAQSRVLRRLVKDTVRIELQLENSLLLASPDDSGRLLMEEIRVGPILQLMSHHWPDLEIQVSGEAIVRADSRALESILKNFLQNAVVHGRASRVDIDLLEAAPSLVHLRIRDNGRGFHGDRGKLGQMFLRHGSTSGSGLGLYLASNLARRMKGEVRFEEANPNSTSHSTSHSHLHSGFSVDVFLPGRVVVRSGAVTEEGAL